MTDIEQVSTDAVRAEHNPPWVDASEYPFVPRYIEVDGAYDPQDHARRLEAVIERLGLRDITLVVHDFGGPIGLNYAIRHPDNVKRIVLFNTWMWSLADDARARMLDRIIRSPLGAFLYRRINVSPRFLLPQAVQDRAKLPAPIHHQYVHPFPTAESRNGMLALARALVGSSSWYEALWSQQGVLSSIPTLLLWGMKDIAFSPRDLERWQSVFASQRTISFPEAGHFVQEEVDAATLNAVITQFIDLNP
jgi:haloalkane dehalogenase